MIFLNAKLLNEQNTKYIITDEEDIIVEIGNMNEFDFNKYHDSSIKTVDIQEKLLLPNFIDQHIHGAVGFDCMDILGNADAVTKIAEFLPTINVGAFVPTIMTGSYDSMINSAIAISKLMDMPYSSKRADILGINVEGPFLSSKYRGAHLEKYLSEPDINFVTKLQQKCNGRIKMLTYAIELDPDFRFLNALKDLNIIPCCGHTAANGMLLTEAIKNGLKCITHINNAMGKIGSGQTNLLSEKSLTENIYVELISDGYHVNEQTINEIYKKKDPCQIILISDSTRANGMVDGQYELGGQIFTKTENECRLPNGALAGSVLQLPNALSNFMNFTNANIKTVLPMLTSNPAKLLNVENKYGSIEIGKRLKRV